MPEIALGSFKGLPRFVVTTVRNFAVGYDLRVQNGAINKTKTHQENTG